MKAGLSKLGRAPRARASSSPEGAWQQTAPGVSPGRERAVAATASPGSRPGLKAVRPLQGRYALAYGESLWRGTCFRNERPHGPIQQTGPRLRPDAGLTLIEILVAVTLLALLSAGMLTALAMSAGSWSQTRERLTLDRRIATANQLLYSQFAAVTPVLMQPPALSGAPPAPFFHGEPKQMRFVSSYSLDAGPRGGLIIVELNVQNAKEGERLVLTQSPYRGPFSTGRYAMGTERDGPAGFRILYSPVRPRADSLIVADQLESCLFEYQREPRTPGEPAEWLPFWGDANQLPAAIRVRLAPAKREARLQPVAITAEVRARYAPPFGPGQNSGPQLERDVIEIRTPNGTILRRGPR